MQRKLSEIAEIPKILSSTLYTVSQTFDKLVPSDASEMRQITQGVQRRRFSYDEDAVDYELSTGFIKGSLINLDFENEEIVSEDDDKLGESASTRNDEIGGFHKDVTPESDYSSEENYRVYRVDSDSDDSDYDHDYEQDDQVDSNDDDSDDFNNITYTWNLRNYPRHGLDSGRFDNGLVKGRITYNVVEEVSSELTLTLTEPSQLEEFSQRTLQRDKQEKLDKLERSWPWADREKIIYKQSTCHLVPRKPFGIIEQRIQLLAKQNLAAKLNKSSHGQN